MKEKYLFGDTDLAAQRLRVLAGVFADTTRDFLLAVDIQGPTLAYDLGCGPGCTTHLVAETLRCRQTVGLDNSEPFIGLARETASAGVSFRLHDVTAMPFPDGPAEVIYGRYLLTHLPDPEARVSQWATQLRTGGKLLVEEVEAIDTQVSAFAEYLATVDAMLTDAGRQLYIGPRLAAMPSLAGLKRTMTRVAPLAVTNDLAARMFVMNIRTWRDNPFIRANRSPDAVANLESRLQELAHTPTDETGIHWQLRQIAYESGS